MDEIYHRQFRFKAMARRRRIRAEPQSGERM
jgi:hypothetical protein